MSNNRTLTQDEQNKLKRLVDEGVKNALHIKDLKDSFRDTVKAVAEELDMKPKVINHAIRSALNSNIEQEKEHLESVEEVLAVTGRA
jgi:biopolymer transport protein ExbB/TolQ